MITNKYSNLFQVLCNGAICIIVMVGAILQSIVLGNLRPVEHVQFRERLWNWVIYKFIFMFIILKAYTLDKVALWLFWYSTLGFLHLMTSLCKDRFEYVSTIFSYLIIIKWLLRYPYKYFIGIMLYSYEIL